MKKYYFALFFSFVFADSFSQDNNKDYTEAFKLVDVWLEAQVDFDKLPGLTAIVVDDQEVLWSAAFGLSNIEKNIKAETSSLFSICSISKLFTSVAIMQLYDEGKLRLDDRVSDLLPAYTLKQKYPGSAPITIRSLLTHSSGLPREAGYAYWNGPDFYFPSKEQIDAALAKQETLYPVSTYYQYSNLALTLLGEIIEEITSDSYDEYIQENILNPLSLKDTRTNMPEGLYGSQLAIGYSALGRSGGREKVNLFQANGIAPAAGFSSSVGDLGKFASWQFRLRDSEAKEILNPSTLKNMQNVHWTDPNWKKTWGLGFSVYRGGNGNTWVGHQGSCPGYRSSLQIDLGSKRAYSVMINANGSSPPKYTNGIGAILNKFNSSKNEESEGAKDLQEYVGNYSNMPWWAEMYISTWKGKLVSISLPSEKPGESMVFYKHIKGDIFQRIRDNNELGEELVFKRDKDGEIHKLKSHGYFAQRIKK